jgi:hypothetical protein
LKEALEKLDELLDSDDLPSEEWHIINNAFHTLEDLLEEV